jgi:hypothetical protein
MANTLTALINAVWGPLSSAPKEVRGALDAIRPDVSNVPVAIGQPLKITQIGAQTAGAWTPSMYENANGDQTPTSVTLTPAGASSYFNITDEEKNALLNTGDVAFENYMQQNIQQAQRAVSSTVGAALITALKTGASRATGTAGTTPFASDITALENAKYELKRNGAPQNDLVCVLSSAAWLAFRNLGIVQQASLNGGDARKTGMLGMEAGFELFEDFGISATTAGAMTGFQLDATSAIGLKTLTFDGGTVNSTGCVAGDVITIGSGGGTGTADTNKYVVGTGSTSTSGSIVINDSGLLVAHVDNDEITIGSAYTPSFAFSRSAIASIIRPVACNVGGQVVGTAPMIDQYGHPGTLIEIRGKGMSKYEYAQAYGFVAQKQYAIITILG